MSISCSVMSEFVNVITIGNDERTAIMHMTTVNALFCN